MKDILTDYEQQGIEKLRTTSPEANKIEYTEHDMTRATLNTICILRDEPYNIVEKPMEAFSLEDLA